MILGLGMDLIEISRFEQEISLPGASLIDEVLLPAEIEYCRTMHDPGRHYAVRFAAKKALFKALGAGDAASTPWHDIEVRRDQRGRPSLVLAGETLRMAEAAGVRKVHLSLTHSDDYAGAVVALES